jgi:DNA-binding NarL/FixJ family response regulator
MITISIVEDLSEIRNGIAKVINAEPDMAIVELYTNAEIAVYDIIEKQPDIVIMDINLPGMNGIECIKRLKPHCTQTQFMIFTIYENDEKVFDALNAGASSYILKKTEPAKIVESIRELQSGGSPMSSTIARKLVSIFQRSQQAVSAEAAVLSKREMEILELLSKGFLYKEIADKTGISFGTVRQHIFHIYEKLHVHNKTEAINKVYGNR